MKQSEYNAIPVGEEYRELEKSEVTRSGDELLSVDGQWKRVGVGLTSWPVLSISVGMEKLDARIRRIKEASNG